MTIQPTCICLLLSELILLLTVCKGIKYSLFYNAVFNYKLVLSGSEHLRLHLKSVCQEMRRPQTPVKSLILAYPEALKSRFQDSMVLTRTEAAGLPPTGARGLAGAGLCYLH